MRRVYSLTLYLGTLASWSLAQSGAAPSVPGEVSSSMRYHLRVQPVALPHNPAASPLEAAPRTDVEAAAPKPGASAPRVELTAPTAGATLAGTAILQAAVNDETGVAGVQFQVNGVDFGPEATAAPYASIWDTTTGTNGPHSLSAVVRDSAGKKKTSSYVTVTVDNAIMDTTPPSVSLAAPAAGARVSGVQSVSAIASDNTSVAAVQLQVDGMILGNEITRPPYMSAWNTAFYANGAHTLVALARDSFGNITFSSPVSVLVSNSAAPAPASPPEASPVASPPETSPVASPPETFPVAPEPEAPPAPLPPSSLPAGPAGCASSAGTWQNAPFTPQTGRFTLQFDATPGMAKMDGVIGTAAGAASDYGQLAGIVRFNNTGTIDARNGGAYAAASPIPYEAGTSYHFRLDVNVPAHSYSAYVRQGPGAERLIGSNFNFRSEMSRTPSLIGLGIFASTGRQSVCGLSIAPAGSSATFASPK